jgi:hypothetical protein
MARTAATGENGSDWRLAIGDWRNGSEWRMASSEWWMVKICNPKLATKKVGDVDELAKDCFGCHRFSTFGVGWAKLHPEDKSFRH